MTKLNKPFFVNNFHSTQLHKNKQIQHSRATQHSMQLESKLDYGFIVNSNIDFSTNLPPHRHHGQYNISTCCNGNYIKMGKSLKPSKSFLEIETLKCPSIQGVPKTQPKWNTKHNFFVALVKRFLPFLSKSPTRHFATPNHILKFANTLWNTFVLNLETIM